MNKHYTIMIIPEKQRNVKSYQFSKTFLRYLALSLALLIIMVGIFAFDYIKIMQQIYENKHLAIENQQLKEQVQLSQVKLDQLYNDFKRISIFERKLRIVTGLLENSPETLSKPLPHIPAFNQDTLEKQETTHSKNNTSHYDPLKIDNIKKNKDFLKLKSSYDRKMASNFGLAKNDHFTKQWSKLTQQSFALSEKFAIFAHQNSLLKQGLADLELSIHKLDSGLYDRVTLLKSTPSLLPTKGWITSYYGIRKSPISGRQKMHEGLDIGARRGTEIIATADGLVVFSGRKSGFGKFVQIDHGFGIETFYAHSEKVLVSRGRRVKRGDAIAKVGNSGLSTAPHVHYEIRVNGNPVDPLYFVLDWPII